MNGEMNFESALDKRIEIIGLTRKGLTDYAVNFKPKITPGMDQLVDRLLSKGMEVCLISGGIDILVERVASTLSIPEDRVYANRIVFDNDDAIGRFDPGCSLYRSDGKAEVVDQLSRRFNTAVAMVGDGFNDAAACPPALVFIGFGVNVIRSAVKTATPYYCETVTSLVELFEAFGLIDPLD